MDGIQMQMDFNNPNEVTNKVYKAIERLKAFEPEGGYHLSFSGGKDSQCIYHLAKMAGVQFEAVYRVTGIDPPELVRFIKEQYPDVRFDIPKDKNGKRITMWSLIKQKKMPPSRMMRYCCVYLKESAGNGKLNVTGVRWAESPKRRANHGVVDVKTVSKKIHDMAKEIGANSNAAGFLVLNDDNDDSRRMVEHCYRTKKSMVNPIVDWEDYDVWYFLNSVAKVPHCCLYDMGQKRIGCIGCPLSHHAKEELERYPKYRALYMKAFEQMLVEREKAGLESQWKDAEDVMKWFLCE